MIPNEHGKYGHSFAGWSIYGAEEFQFDSIYGLLQRLRLEQYWRENFDRVYVNSKKEKVKIVNPPISLVMTAISRARVYRRLHWGVSLSTVLGEECGKLGIPFDYTYAYYQLQYPEQTI